MKYLQDFDLCIESHHNIIVDDVSTFFWKLQLADENIVLFKSMESLGTTNHVNFKSILIKSIVNKVMLQPNLSGNEYTQKFIEVYGLTLDLGASLHQGIMKFWLKQALYLSLWIAGSKKQQH